MSQPTPKPFSVLSRVAAPLALLFVLPSAASAGSLTVPVPSALGGPTAPVWGVVDTQLGTPNTIDGLSVEELDDGTTVLRVEGSRKPTFNVYRLSDPERLVVDIAGSETGKVVPHVPLDTWACGRVTVDGVEERDASLVRLVVELKREASYIVLPKGEELVVTVTPREVAPEAYFAHKSAAERQAEIERSARDVKALEAEARALSSQAQVKAREADLKVGEARSHAQSAREAEIRAKAAERRATQAETQARKTLEDAKGGKLRLRRALRKAEQARSQAEKERKKAQADRKKAESGLASARKKLDAERVRLEAARGRTEAERAELARARGRVQKVEAAAKAELAKAKAKTLQADREASRVLDSARSELAQAEAANERAKTKAAAQLAQAEREANKAARAAKAADAAAKKKLEAAASEAAAQLRQARADAAATEASAKRKLAVAEAAVGKAEKRAEAKRREAEKAETRAELLLVEARAKAAFESSQTREAARKTEADAKAKAATILAAAKVEAKAKVDAATADAERKAKQQLAAARKEAERRLATAKAEAKASAVKEAERELAKIRAKADKEIARRVAAAKAKAQKEADADLARARTRATALEAEARAKLAAAETTLADAQADAAAKKKNVAALERRAKAALARAEEALADAESERKAAASARKAADQTLTQTQRKVAKARRSGKMTEELTRSLAAAQKDKAVADGRLSAAKKDISRLRSDRDALTRTLAKQRATSKALAGKIQARSKELAALEKKVANARKALGAKGKAGKELSAAKADAERARAAQTSLTKEVSRLQTAARSAENKAAAAERKVAQLEQSGARRKALSEAKSEAQAAQKKADAASRQAREAKERLARVDAQLEKRQQELSDLERQRKALASEGASLRRRNADTKVQLDEAEAELEALRASLEAERGKLRGVEDQVQRAQLKLDERVASRGTSKASERGAGSDAAGGAFIKDVRFEDDGHESRVIVELEGPVRFEGKSLTPDIQLLALAGARIDPRLERSLDASAYSGPVQRITSFSEDGGAKVIVATRGDTQPRIEQADGTLVWHFPHGRSGARPQPTRHEVSSLPGSKVGGVAAGPRPPTTVTTAATTLAMAPAGSSRSIGGTTSNTQPVIRSKRWRGERIDIELQDAPIKDVLLLFSDIGRVNIIAGRNVEGSVTMKLAAVPWDQALDIILRSLSLGMVREGNVIRVATNEDLDNERRQAIEQANARVQLKPLQTRLVPISYATVEEMIPKVQSVLSPRGTVTPDSRTNTLIIMDVADNIAMAEQLILSLDTQTPQVLIEARIVEARTTFVRQLGIQWGFDFTASPGTGNPTGLLFPNSAGVGGGATGIPVDSRGLILPGAAANPNYVVDLPAPVGTGAGGAIGFSFGSINGNLNTNLRISQSEETGEVRIISAPKIVTLDNSEAQIEEGVQIPISQVSAQGVNTRFVNATLSLRVTPHVTNEGAVLLDVQVQKNEADFINTGARGDPTILTKQARSRMLVNDSDTAVIGGIYSRNKAVSFTKVPWLADIPIVGWFFKNKSEADTRSEVLIFLTPKIVNRASSIGG